MIRQIVSKIHYWTIPHEANQYKPHVVRHKTLAVYSALLVGIKLFVMTLLFFVYPTPAEFSTITVKRIVELTNQARQEQRLVPLKHNALLDLSAKQKAQDMLKNNYFAHTSPQGVKPWYWFNQAGYQYTFAGENLAMNFIEAEDAIAAWLKSPTHRENIMSENYSDIGIAVVIGMLEGRETTLVVQHFGKTHYVAGETFTPSTPPIQGESVSGPTGVTHEAAQEEVKLQEQKPAGTIGKIVYYSERFFLILLGFIILNLILTIIIRVEIQHKPIILHCFLVIFIALVMIFMNTHFIEGINKMVNIV